MAILEGSVDEIAKQDLDILRDPERLKKMSQIGLESKKNQGGIGRIANLIVEYIKTSHPIPVQISEI